MDAMPVGKHRRADEARPGKIVGFIPVEKGLHHVVRDEEPVHGLFVHFDAQSGPVGDAVETAHDLDWLLEQVVAVQVDAGDGGPGGVGEHGAEMGGPGGGESVADHLEPERHVGLRAEDALVLHPRGAAADDETVADRLADRRGVGWRTEMHGDGAADDLPQLPVAQEVGLRDGRLEHGDDVEPLQAAHDRHGRGGVVHGTVGVEVHPEVARHVGVDRRHLFVDVVPGPLFELDGRVPVVHGVPDLADPVVRRPLVGPPGYGHPVPRLAAQQLVTGDLERLADHVVKSHLQSGADRIVLHEIRRALSHDALHALVGHPRVDVVDDGLAPAHETGVGGDLAQFEDGPVVYRPLRHGPLSLRERHGDGEAFHVGDFQGHEVAPFLPVTPVFAGRPPAGRRTGPGCCGG